jgi:transcription-repair coupling factor (superfamily II helicase)
MLANAVHEMKHEKVEPLPTTMIDLGTPTYIPKNYIPLDRHRMDIYRKIAVARTPADLQQIEAELADVYGPVPEEVKLLLDIGELRIAAAKWDIRHRRVPAGPGMAGTKVFSCKQNPGQRKPMLSSPCPRAVRIPDPKTIELRLNPNFSEPRTLRSLFLFLSEEKMSVYESACF